MRLEAERVPANSTPRRAAGFGRTARHLAARPLLLLALFVCGAPAAMATQTTKIYAWRDARGVVSYSQNPPPAGTRGATSREIDTRSFTPAQSAAVKSYLAGLDAAELADARRFRGQVDVADRGVGNAVQALARAERAFHQGRAPVAGERVGNAGGGSRLRPAYFARQKQLELAVEQARARLSDAYRARGAISP